MERVDRLAVFPPSTCPLPPTVRPIGPPGASRSMRWKDEEDVTSGLSTPRFLNLNSPA